MDRKAWLATVRRVARVDSDTKQKRKHRQSLKMSEVIGESHTVQRTIVHASLFSANEHLSYPIRVLALLHVYMCKTTKKKKKSLNDS